MFQEHLRARTACAEVSDDGTERHARAVGFEEGSMGRDLECDGIVWESFVIGADDAGCGEYSAHAFWVAASFGGRCRD
ncbi:hypothetical protein ADL19_10030 [Streptomyces purpurogeneiscleroticus]|nr:hypothetical protein ADL19_10030 [Streptomyces purpurogeneiscleroticus]